MTFVDRQKDSFFRDVTSLSGLAFNIAVLLLVLFLGYIELFSRLLYGVVAVIVISVVVRQFYFKTRPKRLRHRTWIEKIEASAFPSIHSARGWLFTVILGDFFGSVPISILLIVLALLVSYSRVYLRQHDGVDVTFGAVLGIFIGFLLVIYV